MAIQNYLVFCITKVIQDCGLHSVDQQSEDIKICNLNFTMFLVSIRERIKY